MAKFYFDERGLAGYWPLNSGLVIEDVSGNNRFGTITSAVPAGGIVPPLAGKRAGAIYYGTSGGSTNHATLIPNLFSSNVLTVSLWAYELDWLGGYQCLFSIYTANGDSVEIFKIASVAQFFAGNFAAQALSSTYPSTPLRWMHFALTSDGTTTRLYINGLPDGAGTQNFSTLSATAYVGGRGLGFSFNGYLDELICWNRCLAPAEIFDLSTVPFRPRFSEKIALLKPPFIPPATTLFAQACL